MTSFTLPFTSPSAFFVNMNLSADRDLFVARLEAFHPKTHACERAIAMYSAAVALCDDEILAGAIAAGSRFGLKDDDFYEIVLQSYLFLGFPRMLSAAENLSRVYPGKHDGLLTERISPEESRSWFEDGTKLCRKVYADKYDVLMNKVAMIGPEIFRWMIIEGYGKVLSRPALDIVSREMSIIAFLMMEDRAKQLQSHIMGALNVGASVELIKLVVGDIGPAAGRGFESSRNILSRLGVQ